MTWRATLERDGTRHVTPIDDYRPHVHAPSCWCGPRLDDDGVPVFVHSSLDRREKRGELPPS